MGVEITVDGRATIDCVPRDPVKVVVDRDQDNNVCANVTGEASSSAARFLCFLFRYLFTYPGTVISCVNIPHFHLEDGFFIDSRPKVVLRYVGSCDFRVVDPFVRVREVVGGANPPIARVRLPPYFFGNDRERDHEA